MIMLFGLSHLQWTSWHHNCVHWDLTWVRQSEGLWVCNQSREPCMQPSKEPTVHTLFEHMRTYIKNQEDVLSTGVVLHKEKREQHR